MSLLNRRDARVQQSRLPEQFSAEDRGEEGRRGRRTMSKCTNIGHISLCDNNTVGVISTIQEEAKLGDGFRKYRPMRLGKEVTAVSRCESGFRRGPGR